MWALAFCPCFFPRFWATLGLEWRRIHGLGCSCVGSRWCLWKGSFCLWSLPKCPNFPKQEAWLGMANASWRLRHPQVVGAKGWTCYLLVLKDQVWSINRETCQCSGDRRGDLWHRTKWVVRPLVLSQTLPIEPRTQSFASGKHSHERMKEKGCSDHSANVLESVTRNVCTSSLSCMLGVFSRLFMYLFSLCQSNLIISTNQHVSCGHPLSISW